MNDERYRLDGKRILVTGATGFIGRNLVPVLARFCPGSEIIEVSSSDYDLTDPIETARMFEEIRPQAVFNLAGYVGGILANKRYPADFYYRNLMITVNTIHYAARSGVEKFMALVGGCSYPADAPSPIREEWMWKGYPQPESAPYSIAKKTAFVQLEAYSRQYGFRGIAVVPGNVYGPHDNFSLEDSHVIPALVRKFLEAVEQGRGKVTAWGSGRPVRDFVYVGDVVELLPELMERYESTEPLNVSSGRGVTIRELVETVARVCGFEGEIEWDASKPDGQMEKTFSVEKLHSMGYECPTPLEEGLRRTVEWFREARRKGEARL